MNEIVVSLFDVSLFILVAEIIRSFLAKYNLPYLVGEIIAGMIIGPYAMGMIINQIVGFPLISINEYITFLSEFSIILLIFTSGLEHGISPIRSGGLYSFLGATLGALLPFLVTFYLYSDEFGSNSALFLGVAMGATSLAAVAYIIEEEKLKGKGIDFLISASASDDVVDLLLLSIAISISSETTLHIQYLGVKIIELIIIWLVIFIVSVILIPRVINRLSDKYIEEFPFVVLFGLTLIMVSLGYSPIISAFIAGVSIANSTKSEKIKQIGNTLLSIFGSLFFVVVGSEVNLTSFNLSTIVFALELTGIAGLFKWIGVFPFAFLRTRNFKMANTIAIGMIPRGETGLVVASIGESLNLLNQVEFEGIILMSLLTTLIGGIVFKTLVKKTKLE
ncbi:sodium:proton antiporter [Sulfolobus sp. A20-N-G8]|nr:sodium:proton antiporter [Sulfolobus sp. A20-N-G8]